VAFGYYYRPRVPATRERFQNRGAGRLEHFQQRLLASEKRDSPAFAALKGCARPCF